MIIRKANSGDIDFVEKIYDKIHQAEENGLTSIGKYWMEKRYLSS